MENLQGELLVMKTMGIRSNFTELGRIYNINYRQGYIIKECLRYSIISIVNT